METNAINFHYSYTVRFGGYCQFYVVVYIKKNKGIEYVIQ